MHISEKVKGGIMRNQRETVFYMKTNVLQSFNICISVALKGKLSGNSDQSFSNFINTCNTVLDKQLPKKKSMLEVINRLYE